MKTGKTHRYALLALLVLAGCSDVPTQDPTIVLERAAEKARSLRSASFDARFSYATKDPEFSASGSANGVMADGGRQVSFSFNGSVTMPSDGPDQTVSVEGEVVVADESEAYLKLDRVEGSVLRLPGIGLVPPTMLDTWLRIGSSATGSTRITPDPSFLDMQVQTISIARDRGFEDIDGHRCHAYDVTIDVKQAIAFLERTAAERGESFDRAEAEAVVSAYDAEGSVWIDAESWTIRHIEWEFDNAEGYPESSASFSVRFDNHDVPVEITPPATSIPLSEAATAEPLPLL